MASPSSSPPPSAAVARKSPYLRRGGGIGGKGKGKATLNAIRRAQDRKHGDEAHDRPWAQSGASDEGDGRPGTATGEPNPQEMMLDAMRRPVSEREMARRRMMAELIADAAIGDSEEDGEWDSVGEGESAMPRRGRASTAWVATSKEGAAQYGNRVKAVMQRPVTVQGVYYWEDVDPNDDSATVASELQSDVEDGNHDGHSVNRMAMARAGSSRRNASAGPLPPRRDYFNPGGGAARPESRGNPWKSNGSASRQRQRQRQPSGGLSGGMFVVGPSRGSSPSRAGTAATSTSRSETPALDRRRKRQKQLRL